MDEGVVKPLAPPNWGPPPPRLVAVRRVYVTRKKEAATFSMVVTRALFLNTKSFCILFGSGATYSFIST